MNQALLDHFAAQRPYCRLERRTGVVRRKTDQRPDGVVNMLCRRNAESLGRRFTDEPMPSISEMARAYALAGRDIERDERMHERIREMRA